MRDGLNNAEGTGDPPATSSSLNHTAKHLGRAVRLAEVLQGGPVAGAGHRGALARPEPRGSRGCPVPAFYSKRAKREIAEVAKTITKIAKAVDMLVRVARMVGAGV